MVQVWIAPRLMGPTDWALGLLLVMPLRMVREEPERANDPAPALNVRERMSQGVSTFGAVLAPLPKKMLAVPSLAGARLVFQFRPLDQLEFAPPESQVSARPICAESNAQRPA